MADLTYVRHWGYRRVEGGGHPQALLVVSNKLLSMGFEVVKEPGGLDLYTDASPAIVLSLIPEWARDYYEVREA